MLNWAVRSIVIKDSQSSGVIVFLELKQQAVFEQSSCKFKEKGGEKA